MAVKTYDPKSIRAIIAGFVAGGYAEDSFLKIGQVSDGVSVKSGADSEIARSMNTNRIHTVTFTLMATSVSNDAFTGLFNLDRLTPGGLLFPILIKDLMGNTTFAASECWITKLPDVEFGAEVGDREWVFNTGEPTTYMVGGSL